MQSRFREISKSPRSRNRKSRFRKILRDLDSIRRDFERDFEIELEGIDVFIAYWKIERAMSSKLVVPVALGLSLVTVTALVVYYVFKKDEDETDKRVKTSRVNVIEVSVPKSIVPALIGRNGSNIKEIEKKSGALIHFKKFSDKDYDVCIMRGRSEATQLAETLVHDFINQQPVIVEGTMMVPGWACGRIIGTGGENINEISHRSGARVKLEGGGVRDNSTQRAVTFKGTEEQIAQAKSLIEACPALGYLRPGCCNHYMPNEISHRSGARVKLEGAGVRDNSTQRAVTFKGTEEQIAQAKSLIEACPTLGYLRAGCCTHYMPNEISHHSGARVKLEGAGVRDSSTQRAVTFKGTEKQIAQAKSLIEACGPRALGAQPARCWSWLPPRLLHPLYAGVAGLGLLAPRLLHPLYAGIAGLGLLRHPLYAGVALVSLRPGCCVHYMPNEISHRSGARVKLEGAGVRDNSTQRAVTFKGTEEQIAQAKSLIEACVSLLGFMYH
ncbi:KH domain-containing protein [Phthorimaea operculella]|nr:KH domain-containing protein [Phthorimaea operculella]